MSENTRQWPSIKVDVTARKGICYKDAMLLTQNRGKLSLTVLAELWALVAIAKHHCKRKHMQPLALTQGLPNKFSGLSKVAQLFN